MRRPTDVVELRFEPNAVQGMERQTHEQLDARLQDQKRVPKRPALHLFRACGCSRIFYTPVGTDRLPRPDRTNLTRRVVTDGKLTIETRRMRGRKLTPGLAPQLVGPEPRRPQQVEREWMHRSPGVTASAVRDEFPPAPLRQQCLGEMLRAELPVHRNRT